MREDELIGTLPMQNNTGSPALAGQPPSITGANPAIQPTPDMSGAPGTAPALASAPPASGSADIGAPLSNAAPDQQAGAGANLDLIEDRGNPKEYWAKNLNELGSAKALDLMGSAANAASGKTGQQAEMNPEEHRRAGVKANQAFGVGNTREEQDNAVESVIYAPVVSLVQEEVNTGVLGNEDGVVRVAQMIAQVEGIKDEDDLKDIISDARSRVAGQGGGKEEKGPAEESGGGTLIRAEEDGAVEVTNEMDALEAASAINTRTTQLNYERDRKKKAVSKDYDGDGKPDSVFGRMKNWWKKGRDDPSTSVDESIETYKDADGNYQTREVEVTQFMGGMTRQELGMFVFQWGSQMMAHGDKGFGTAMGIAGDESMKGHQARTQLDQTNQDSAAQLKIENQIAKGRVDAATMTGEAALARASIVEADDGFYRIDLETGEMTPMQAGDKTPRPKSSSERDFRDQVAVKALMASGYEENQANLIIYAGGLSEEEARSLAEEVWIRNVDDGRPAMYEGRASEWRGLTDNEREDWQEDWKKKFIDRVSVKRRGALGGAGEVDGVTSALDKYGDKDE